MIPLEACNSGVSLCLYSVYYEKIHWLTSEFHINSRKKPISHESRSDDCDIRSVFQVKINVEFTRQAVNFS